MPSVFGLTGRTGAFNDEIQLHYNLSSTASCRRRGLAAFPSIVNWRQGVGDAHTSLCGRPHGPSPTRRHVWSADMSLAAATTTTNQAEYLGLVIDLQAVHRQLAILEVGQLIIRQLAQYRQPNNDMHFNLDRDACHLADNLGVEHMHYHLRAFTWTASTASKPSALLLGRSGLDVASTSPVTSSTG